MTTCRLKLGMVLLSQLVTTVVFSQEIAVTKKASRSLDAKPYAIMALRHHNIKNEDATVANLQFRPLIGFKLAEDLLDLSVFARFNKINGESNVRQGAYTGVLLVKTIQLGPVNIDPYVEHTVVKDQPSNNKLAIYNSMSRPVSTRAGMVTLGSGLELGTYMNNTDKEEEAPAEASSKLQREEYGLVGLSDDGTGTRKKTTSDFYHEWDLSAGIKPQAIPGLDVTFRTMYNATYKEKIVVEDDSSRSTYPLEVSTSQRLYVTYKISDYLNFINETHLNQSGLWEKRPLAEQFVNLAKLEYTLFK